MRTIYTLLIVSLLCTSCKNDQKTDTSTDNQEYESTATTPAVDQEKPAPRKVVVTKDLLPFSTDSALEFLDLDGLKLGMSIEELNKYNIKANQNLEKITVRSADGNYEAYEITKGGAAVLHLIPKEGLIKQMMFLGTVSTPTDMVGVGTNYASLAHTYPKIASRIDQSGSKVYLRLSDGVQLRMLTEATATGDSTLKDNATVLHILIQ